MIVPIAARDVAAAADHRTFDVVCSKPELRQRLHLLVIGIGGSALGPEFVAAALQTTKAKLRALFFDNTDPDGFDLVGPDLGPSHHRPT